MDTPRDATAAGPKPQGEPRPQRGGSGEGARSALEQLIRQERSRDAQRPREQPADGPVAPGGEQV